MRLTDDAPSLCVASLFTASLIFSIDGEFTGWRDFLGPGMALTYAVYATPIWLMQLSLAACLERGRRGAFVATMIAVGLVVAGFVGWRVYAAGEAAPEGPPALWTAVVGGGGVAVAAVAAIVAPVLAVRWLAGATPGLRPNAG